MGPVPSFRPALLPAILVCVVIAGCTGGTDGPPPSTDATGTAATPVVHATEVPPLHPSVDDYPREQVDIEASGTTHRLAVLVADSSARRQHGLMEVAELPDGVGMLFVGYDRDRTGGFWMKDTLVPLTIAYLAEDGTIVDLVDMAPCEADPCPSYPPDASYRSALEVRQGWFAEHDIGEGAVVHRRQGG